jgi:hypothetical protein
VLALLLGRFGGQPDMVAFCYLGAVGVSLAAVDISVQRRHWLTAWAARQGLASRVNLRRGLRVNVVQQWCGPRAGKSPGMAPASR